MALRTIDSPLLESSVVSQCISIDEIELYLNLLRKSQAKIGSREFNALTSSRFPDIVSFVYVAWRSTVMKFVWSTRLNPQAINECS